MYQSFKSEPGYSEEFLQLETDAQRQDIQIYNEALFIIDYALSLR
jgi:hypothetical protein